MALAIILTIYVARERINRVAAENLISNADYQIQTFLKFNTIEDKRLCGLLEKDTLFLAFFYENEAHICATEEFSKVKTSDFLKRFSELGNETNAILFSKRLNNDFLFYKTHTNYNGKSYATYLIFSADKIFQFLLETNNAILIYIFPIFILSTLISLFGAMKMANPMRSIISKIISFSKIYNKNNVLFEIENSKESEWEIIERSIDESEYVNKKLLSNLKKESKKFSTLLDSISEAILAIDKNGKILFANDAFSSFSSSLDIDSIDHHFLDFIRDYDLKLFMENSLRNYDSAQTFELAFSDSNNQKKYFFISTNPLLDSQGTPYGMVCIFHDLTSIKMAEKMRSDFVANVSHEIRTPLTAIKGYVQTLDSIQIDPSPMNKEIFETIVHNCDRLNALFNDLLSLSTIEATNEIELLEINLRDLTEQAINASKQGFDNNKVIFNTNIEIETIISNDKMLEQILINLITNAIKYCDKDIVIDITWRESISEFTLTLKDNGPGMAKEHLPRIFERFYRIDKSRNRNYGGTGLGLAIVKHLVSKLNGKIKVESTVGSGTLFTLTFKKF